MASTSTRIAAALALTWAAAASFAQNIQFTGTSSDGLAVAGTIVANTSSQAVFQETLADGTRHSQFLLYPNDVYGIQGGWQVQVGATPLFGAYDENYEHGGQIGPEVNAYLTPDGHSSLTLDWAVYPSCHGGCFDTQTLHLDLRSTDGSLFGSSIDSSVFNHYTTGSGLVTSLYERSDQDGTVRDLRQSQFTLSPVPEPQTPLLMLLGLAGIAGVAVKRRPR